MYSKPIIYKVYSIITIVFASIGFIMTLFQAVATDNSLLSKIPYIGDLLTVFKVISIITGVLSLFFSYIEFSSMYTFAEMIEYEKSNTTYPFQRKAFVLPPQFYKKFGSAIFYIVFIIQMITIIILTIVSSVQTKSFITIPLIPVAISMLTIMLIYITYFAKFNSFGDLLEIMSSKEATESMKCNLKSNKSNLLRGYCVFLFVIAIISMILMIILGLIIWSPMSAVIGSSGAFAVFIGLIVVGVINFIYMSILGCYFDNLAKMVESYVIKYRLYED